MYFELLIGSLCLAILAGIVQTTLAFYPRWSPIAFLNGLLLLAVVTPLIINRLTLGSTVGFVLLLVNAFFLALLLLRWCWIKFVREEAFTVIGSLAGLVFFGLHLFVFANTP